MLWNRRSRRSIATPWDLETPLLHWCDGAPWTIGAACQGAMLLGGTGSGKSSGSLATICRSFLRAGFGGLFLTAKRTDAADYMRYARETRRMDDVVVFSPDHRVRYNFIAEEQRQAASPLGLVENLQALIMLVTELGGRGAGAGGGGDNERYFQLEAARLARNALLILVLSRDIVTISGLHEVIVSAPLALEQVNNPDWQRSSACFKALQGADRAAKSESLRADFELALSFFLREWPALSDRTRSCVQSTLTAATDLLGRGAARDMLSSPTSNISPGDCFNGAIVIADFPTLVLNDVGIALQLVLKHAWQRAASRRDVASNSRPIFIVADEAQCLLTPEDERFQAVSRGTRTAVVYASQSISGLLGTFSSQAEPRVHSLLGNLQTRILHQSCDVQTVRYAQELIGRARRMQFSSNRSQGGDWLAPILGPEPGGSTAMSDQMEFELEASHLNSLAKGGPPHWMTEAIVYQGGKCFPDGRTWRRVAFPQRF